MSATDVFIAASSSPYLTREMSRRLRQMNCVWAAVWTYLNWEPHLLICCKISRWVSAIRYALSDSLPPPLRDEKFSGRKDEWNMHQDTLTIRPHTLFFLERPPPLSITFLLLTSISAPRPPSSPTPPRPALPPRRAATLPRSVSAGVLVSDGVLVDPASGPVVFQCHTSQAEH